LRSSCSSPRVAGVEEVLQIDEQELVGRELRPPQVLARRDALEELAAFDAIGPARSAIAFLWSSVAMSAKKSP
jgi:hypothetical protein